MARKMILTIFATMTKMFATMTKTFATTRSFVTMTTFAIIANKAMATVKRMVLPAMVM